MSQPVFRFAPSPNGHLHLGHALSAYLNQAAADALGGRLLLRIENIDQARCTPELERQMLEDLAWLGLRWETPVVRQSEHFHLYAAALEKLERRGLAYRGYLTRSEIKQFVAEQEAAGRPWPRDPDGAPLYPGDAAVLAGDELRRRLESDAPYAVRLDMKAALEQVKGDLTWWEGPSEASADDPSETEWFAGKRVPAEPAAWGDVVLARKDTPTSYHLSVVVDDARQSVTDVLRGRDLYEATSVHRLLQVLLDLPEPRYRHHRLVVDETGRKLSKSSRDASLLDLRLAGMKRTEVLAKVGIHQVEE